jgi:hypothetical protein
MFPEARRGFCTISDFALTPHKITNSWRGGEKEGREGGAMKISNDLCRYWL